MARLNLPKKARQRELMERLKADPFLTDEELKDIFHVSVQTIVWIGLSSEFLN